MSSDATRLRAAADKYGASVDHIAAQYTNPVTGKRLSGAALLLKVAQGESSALTNPNARTEVSSTGARGWLQFMPSSRSVAIHKFGVDPWRSPEEAIHAAALHLRGKINGSTGLEGYNPGMASYPGYVLGQKVGATHEHSGTGGPGVSGPVQQTGAKVASAAGFDVVDSSAPAPATSPIQSSPLTPPKFSAGPTTPAGYQPVQSSGGPAPAPAAPQTDSVVPSVTLPASSSAAAVASSPASSGAPAASRGSGSVVVAPGADKPGKGLQKPVLTFLHELAGVQGRTVTVTTGTNHNQYVQGRPGVVSDHYAGNAADLGMGGDARSSPAVSRKGDLVAAHAIQLASGLSFQKALAIAQGGGVHNFDTTVDGRRVQVQVLWKTNIGGNHYNHVHVGVAPR